MKELLLVVLALFAAGVGHAQQVQGGFVVANVPECAEFHYFSAGRFIHFGQCDRGPYYGSGTFQLKADSLLLRFDEWQEPATAVALDSSSLADSLACSLTVRVLDIATGEALPGATAVSLTLPNTGACTDSQGLARLSSSMPRPGKLCISCIGYTTAYVEVDFRQKAHFLVRLRPLSSHHIAGNTRQSFFIKHRAGRLPLLRAQHYTSYQPATPSQTRDYVARYQKLAD